MPKIRFLFYGIIHDMHIIIIIVLAHYTLPYVNLLHYYPTYRY